MQSDRSIQVHYTGKPLESKTPCHWKVLVKTIDGTQAESAPAFWSMGILEPHEWKAQWIGMQDDTSDDTYRHEVIEGKLVIKKATLTGQSKSIDVTSILNAKIKKGTLRCQP